MNDLCWVKCTLLGTGNKTIIDISYVYCSSFDSGRIMTWSQAASAWGVLAAM